MTPGTSFDLLPRFIGAALAITLAAVCSPGRTSEFDCVTPAEPGDHASPQAGQVVSIDPDSGELVHVPPPPEATAIRQRDTGPVVTRTLPDGTVVAEVGDRFRSHLVAQVVDGKLVTCHKSLDAHPDAVEIEEEADR